MTRSIKEAEQHCTDQSLNGPPFAEGHCQEQCHDAYDIPSNGEVDAKAGWFKAFDRHPATDPRLAPRGSFNHWLGGTEGHGHATIKRFTGADDWSVDFGRTGFWNIVKDPRDIAETWDLLHYVGWSWDIDGVSVKPVHVPTPKFGHIRAAAAATKIALSKRKNSTPRRHHLATALRELLRALAGK